MWAHDLKSPIRPTPALSALALVCAGVGCSLLVDADRPQCTTDADCRARGFGDAICVEALCQSAPLPELEVDAPREPPDDNDNPPIATDPGGDAPLATDASEAGVPAVDAGGDPEWACLQHFEPPPVAAGSLVSYRLRFERGRQANVPPDGLTLRLCRDDDATCAAPSVDIPEPDATGLLTLELDPTFRGYLEVDARDHMPSLVSLPPSVVSPPEPQIIRMVERSDFSNLMARTDIPYDSERGFAFVLTNSCLDQRAAGVVLSSPDTDELTAQYYYRDGQPDPEALQTDAQGAGGWSQLPIGTIRVEARRADSLEFIGVAEFLSRAGFVSYVPIGPTSPP